MLDLCHEQELIAGLWDASEIRVQLSDGLAKHFFEPSGPTPPHFDNHRSYHRYYLRGKAVLTRGEKQFGGYTRDVSRNGIGFVSPIQLMPKEKICMQLPTATLRLEVSRCRRISEGCYDCGAKYSARE